MVASRITRTEGHELTAPFDETGQGGAKEKDVRSELPPQCEQSSLIGRFPDDIEAGV
jgi:hypothetical protein